MLQPVFTACCDESYSRVSQYILSSSTIYTFVPHNMYYCHRQYVLSSNRGFNGLQRVYKYSTNR